MIAMKKLAGLGALAAVLVAGCGQTSFVEVEVIALRDSGNRIRADNIFEIDRCEVTVSGADSGIFSLAGCRNPTAMGGTDTGWRLGIFQYGTEEDSGELSFDVKLFNGASESLGEGSASVPIKAGARQQLAVMVQLDPTNFNIP